MRTQREFVRADVVAKSHGAWLAVDVGRYPGVHPGIHGGGGGEDVVVARIGIDEGWVTPQVDCAGSDSALAAPVGAVAPQGCLQGGCTARRHVDAYRVTDQNGVGRHDVGIIMDASSPAVVLGDVDSRASIVAGQREMAQDGR